MEFKTALADLRTETTCHICLEYLKKPVTIRCGHNFCLSCIRVSWQDLKNAFLCPLCHVHCPERKFTNNYQLGSLTKLSKLLPIKKGKRKRQEEKLLCEKHKQALTSFCQKDLEVLCPRCPLSTDHRLHCVWPIGKAALYHRKKLQRHVEPLKERVELVEKLITLQSKKPSELKRRVEQRREEVESEFDQLTSFLQSDQETLHRQLQDEEMDISAELKESLSECLALASSLKYLIKEMESKYIESDLELLADIKSIYHRCKNYKCPETFSFKFQDYGYRLPPQYSGLDIIIKRFQADVLLDPETAYRKLVISEDKKTVTYRNMQRVLQNPRRFYVCPAVVGSEGYHSGRLYWEVEVQDKPEWVLGVCKESLPRRRKKHVHTDLVQDGLWGIGRESQANYVALGSRKVHLLPKVIPSKIGIFLDLEMGEVSFYNLDDRSLLYIFNEAFTEALYPYFYTGTDAKPLRICTATDFE